MALKAYKEITYKATIKFLEDDSEVGATFRLPRPTDYFVSDDGNRNLEAQRLVANLFKSFEKPVEVEFENENGGFYTKNINKLSELIDLGIPMDLSDCINKLTEAQIQEQERKETLVKKHKSVGSSTKKDIAETKF